jgi:hypothetical protein
MTGIKDGYQLTLQTIFVVVQACEQHDEWREYIIFFFRVQGCKLHSSQIPFASVGSIFDILPPFSFYWHH